MTRIKLAAIFIVSLFIINLCGYIAYSAHVHKATINNLNENISVITKENNELRLARDIAVSNTTNLKMALAKSNESIAELNNKYKEANSKLIEWMKQKPEVKYNTKIIKVIEKSKSNDNNSCLEINNVIKGIKYDEL